MITINIVSSVAYGYEGCLYNSETFASDLHFSDFLVSKLNF